MYSNMFTLIMFNEKMINILNYSKFKSTYRGTAVTISLYFSYYEYNNFS